ncbi:Chromate resistance protein ChrB [Actinomycetospora sp. NBC_00405]|uniref:Chromate resistance protein ChrB n=1 Tax=Actinomycetospora sp. NBC_00405 TaxID=2975952 RepID=UPI002E1CF82A
MPGADPDGAGAWVLLTYRIPREPSTARVGVWRKLKRLGVAQLADGVVALPADARTREQLEWLADEVVEGGGAATVWDARPGGRHPERELAEAMSEARAAEYRAVVARARSAGLDEGARQNTVRRLRGELRRIGRRDYFPPPERAEARRAVDELAASGDHEEATR